MQPYHFLNVAESILALDPMHGEQLTLFEYRSKGNKEALKNEPETVHCGGEYCSLPSPCLQACREV